MKAGRGLTIKRMAELGRASRSGFYRRGADGVPGPDADMDLRDAIRASRWNGPATAGPGSPTSCVGAAGG